eukprot:TRINITY_DN34435_c0_g1_i1.p1 TRINITY_DN34435_c0_g1~~TRINITY_DN34435_c0_g1_i1.p1  ORF type:complete len:1368 (+),score=278.27 TRINITY_DN34435_c0_g1_i1:63-4166(+)
MRVVVCALLLGFLTRVAAHSAHARRRRSIPEAGGTTPTASPSQTTASPVGAAPPATPTANSSGAPTAPPKQDTGTSAAAGSAAGTGSGAAAAGSAAGADPAATGSTAAAGAGAATGSTTGAGQDAGSAGGTTGGHGAEAGSGSGSGHCPNETEDGTKCFVAADRQNACLRADIADHDACELVVVTEDEREWKQCNLVTTCPCHKHEHAHPPPYNIIVLTGMVGVGNLCRHWGSVPPLCYLPYTVQVFILGACWGWLCRGVGGVMHNYEYLSEIDPHLMFYIFLPLLIFESAFATEYHVFKKVVVHALFLAGPGLICASTLTAVVAKYAFGAYQWSWVTCLLFGCMLSATDPVAVVALLKELGAAPAISALIEGESLLNDGTAIVFFNILKGSVATGTVDMTGLEILLELVKVAGGGPVVGLVIGVMTKQSIKMTFNDPAIEITLTVVAAYATFFIAEGYFGVSGVLGLVILGMYLAYHSHVISPEVEHSLHQFWEIIVYLANTLIFAIAGLIIAEKAFEAVSPRDYGYLAVLYVGVNIIRGLGLFMLRGWMNKFGMYQLDRSNSILCTWGGLRGAVGLALALIVFGDQEILCAFPELGARFLFHTAGICTLTLMVNGVSTGRVVARLGLSKVSHSKKYAMQAAYKSLINHSRDTQLELRRQPVFRDAQWKTVNEYCMRDIVDPHNEPGERVPAMDVQRDACEHYYRAYHIAVVHEYEAGTMRAASQRRLLAYLADAEDRAHTNGIWEMIKSKVLEDLFVVTWKETVPGFGGINAKFVHAFDVCIGFLNTHQFILENIASMTHKQQASSRVKDHCKRVRNETVQLVERISGEHPEISMSIKSSNASRNVLNAMRNCCSKNHHDGKIGKADANMLKGMVEKAMDRLRKIPRKLNPAFIETTLHQLCPWYGAIPEVHYRLQNMWSIEPIGKGEPIVGEHKDLSGTWVVVSGVARVQIGNRAEHFGPGYSAGLLGLLTDKKGRYSEVYAETKCEVAYFPELSMRTLMGEFPDFNNIVWDEACRLAARCALSVLALYRDWDHVRIANFVQKGYRVAVQDAKSYPIQLPPRHACILVNGQWKDTLMGHSSGEGPCAIPKHFEDVYVWESPVLFAIPNPLSVSEQARAHWKKITSALFVARTVATLQGHEAGIRAVREVLAGRFYRLIAEAKLEDAPGAHEWRMAQSAAQTKRESPSAGGSPAGPPLQAGPPPPRTSQPLQPRPPPNPTTGQNNPSWSPTGRPRTAVATAGNGMGALSPGHRATESTPWFGQQSAGGAQQRVLSPGSRQRQRGSLPTGGLQQGYTPDSALDMPLLEGGSSPRNGPPAADPSGWGTSSPASRAGRSARAMPQGYVPPRSHGRQTSDFVSEEGTRI